MAHIIIEKDIVEVYFAKEILDIFKTRFSDAKKEFSSSKLCWKMSDKNIDAIESWIGEINESGIETLEIEKQAAKSATAASEQLRIALDNIRKDIEKEQRRLAYIHHIHGSDEDMKAELAKLEKDLSTAKGSVAEAENLRDTLISMKEQPKVISVADEDDECPISDDEVMAVLEEMETAWKPKPSSAGNQKFSRAQDKMIALRDKINAAGFKCDFVSNLARASYGSKSTFFSRMSDMPEIEKI